LKFADSRITLIHCGWNTGQRDFVNQKQSFEMSCALLNFCTLKKIFFINFSSFSEKSLALSFYSQFKYLFSKKVGSKNGVNLHLGFVPVSKELERKIFGKSIFVEKSGMKFSLFTFPYVSRDVLALFLKDNVVQNKLTPSKSGFITINFTLMELNYFLLRRKFSKFFVLIVFRFVIHFFDLLSLRTNLIDRLASLIDTNDNIFDRLTSTS
jgi:hypothetical protein